MRQNVLTLVRVIWRREGGLFLGSGLFAWRPRAEDRLLGVEGSKIELPLLKQQRKSNEHQHLGEPAAVMGDQGEGVGILAVKAQ